MNSDRLANQLGALCSVKQVSAKHRHFTSLHQLYPEIFRKGDDCRPAEDQNRRLGDWTPSTTGSQRGVFPYSDPTAPRLEKSNAFARTKGCCQPVHQLGNTTCIKSKAVWN